MWLLILFTLIGINFAGLFFTKFDIWHAQGFFAQICFLFMFSWTFFQRPKRLECPNIPLGLVHLGVGLNCAGLCYLSFLTQKYNIQNFFPYFNFLCLLVFYHCIRQYLKVRHIEMIVGCMKWMVTFTLLVCLFQSTGKCPYFYFEMTDAYHNNMVSGFLGNGTHLSGFLGSLVPLYLYKPKWYDWAAIPVLAIVLCMAGTTIGDPSVSGPIIAFILISWWILVARREWFQMWLVGAGLFAVACYFVMGDKGLHRFFETNGRIPLWKFYWQVFTANPITGIGIGKINQVYTMTPHPGFRHLHLEYFQFLVELGAPIFLTIVNLIYHFFRIDPEDHLELCLKMCVVGFLISSVFNYSAHLWIPSVWAIFFYAALLTLKSCPKRKEEPNGQLAQRAS